MKEAPCDIGSKRGREVGRHDGRCYGAKWKAAKEISWLKAKKET